MKTILLIRHSEPITDRSLPTAQLPLSAHGIIKAQALFSRSIFRDVRAVYSSPYQRAYSTARILRRCVRIDDRLRERDLGNSETLNAEFWARQYADHDYKNTGGESLNDTRERMTLAMHEILSATPGENAAAVVSHAAAICAYLLNWCAVEVIDEQTKKRKIEHNGFVVLNGKIETPSAFILHFEKGALRKIRFLDME